jgi:hypothetical protein
VRKARRAAALASAPRNPALLHASPGETSSVCLPIPDRLLARISQCAVKGAGQQRVQVPPGNWFAPPGSNRSSGLGNEAAGASGVEGRVGDLASVQAVM